jgi:hypothetical protein
MKTSLLGEVVKGLCTGDRCEGLRGEERQLQTRGSRRTRRYAEGCTAKSEEGVSGEGIEFYFVVHFERRGRVRNGASWGGGVASEGYGWTMRR